MVTEGIEEEVLTGYRGLRSTHYLRHKIYIRVVHPSHLHRCGDTIHTVGSESSRCRQSVSGTRSRRGIVPPCRMEVR